jgi:hypothetical protein
MRQVLSSLVALAAAATAFATATAARGAQPALAATQPETPRPVPAGPPLRVAVLDPVRTGDIPERAFVAFSQSLVPEIRKLQGVSPIGTSEIREMLAFERQRQLLGCGDETCLAEIGGALGVDEIVASQLTLVGSRYTLTFKRLNLRKAKVVQAETRQVDKRDGEELLQVIGPLVEAVFPDRPLREGRTRGVDKEVVRRLNPPPLPRWVFVGTTVAAAAAAGVGGVFGIMSRDAESSWNRQAALKGPIDGATLKGYETAARGNAQTANILFVVGGGLLVAAAVEAFFTDWQGDRLAFAVGPTAVGVAGKF